jgi:hypothetical protein
MPPKMAMHNDPMQRKTKYEKEGTVSRAGHHEGRMDTEAKQSRAEQSRAEQSRAMSTENLTSRKILSGGRKAADQNSNLNNSPKKPEWATGTGTGTGTENMADGT